MSFDPGVLRSIAAICTPSEDETKEHTEIREVISYLAANYRDIGELPEQLVDTARQIVAINRQRINEPTAQAWRDVSTDLGEVGSTVFVTYYAMRGFAVNLREMPERRTSIGLWEVTVHPTAATSSDVYRFKRHVDERWLRVVASHRPEPNLHAQGVATTSIATLLR